MKGSSMRALLTLLVLLTSPLSLHAASYPERPIKLISGFAAGGVTDGIARILAQGLQEKFGQTVIVENKVGASGLLSTREVARSEPDGYTLLVGGFGAQLIPPLVMANYSVDVTKELTPIAGIADFMNVVAVSSRLPVKSVRELIQYAKDNPGKLKFGSAGVGASNYLSAVMFMQKTGIDMVHIPSKGGTGPITDLLTGSVDVVFENIPIIAAQEKSDAVRMLAVTGKQRSEQFPSLPTVAESALPDYIIASWISVFAPAGVPEPLVKRISEVIVEVVKDPSVQAKMKKIGFQPMVMGHTEFGKFFLDERARWKEVVDKAGIKIGK